MAIIVINNQISNELKQSIIKSADNHCQCTRHLYEQCGVGVNASSYFVADSKTTQFSIESVRVFCHGCVKNYHHNKLNLPIMRDDGDSLIQKK